MDGEGFESLARAIVKEILSAWRELGEPSDDGAPARALRAVHAALEDAGAAGPARGRVGEPREDPGNAPGDPSTDGAVQREDEQALSRSVRQAIVRWLESQRPARPSLSPEDRAAVIDGVRRGLHDGRSASRPPGSLGAAGSSSSGVARSQLRAAGCFLGDLQRPVPATEGGAIVAPTPRLGKYEILESLGRGGMCEVFLARDTVLGRRVALKVLSSGFFATAEARERFEREAKAASAVDHPGIVHVFEAGCEGDRPYIALQLVCGTSLQTQVGRGFRFEVRRAAAIVRDVARALQAAHDVGIVHRDIKPGNILLEGEQESAQGAARVYLSDFGLASVAEAETITRTGEILGTPAYMAPEQALGWKADRLSDIYSLGATFYAMLGGRTPHEGSSFATIIASVARSSPVPLGDLIPGLSREAILICEKAMRWDPRHRYTSAGEFADDLDRLLEHRPILARPPTLRYRSALWARRNPGVVAATAAVFALALLGFLAERTWRRGRLLQEARESLSQLNVEGAKKLLGELPWVPWGAGDEEIQLWMDLHIADGDLVRAIPWARRLSNEREQGAPASRRDLAFEKLHQSIREELDGAEALVSGGAWRSGLRDVWNAAGGIAELETTRSPKPSRDPVSGGRPESREEGSRAPPQSRGLAEAAERATRIAQAGLLDSGHDLPAVTLLDEEHAAAGSLFRSRAVRETIQDVLGLEEVDDSPRFQDADRALATILEGREPALHGAEARDVGAPTAFEPLRVHNAELFAALDQLLPLLPKQEEMTVKRWIEILQAIRVVGKPVEVPPPDFEEPGDLDGNGLPDLALADRSGTLRVVEWRPDGLSITGPLSLSPGNDPLETLSLAVLDLDGDGSGELVAFHALPRAEGYESRRGFLRAYRWRDGALSRHGTDYPPPRGGPPAAGGAAPPSSAERFVDGAPSDGCHSMTAGDFDGDGTMDLALGMISFGPDERRVLVIHKIFTEEATRIVLPDGERDADVRCVFAADLDGDGRAEIGAGTGPWKGYDLRLWKHDGSTRSYVGPWRWGPLGSIQEAMPIDVDGTGARAIVLAKCSVQLPNVTVFPERPHTGIPLGVYVLRPADLLARSPGTFPVSGKALAGAFSWFDDFSEELRHPVDACIPRGLSSARWIDGGAAFAVSWHLRDGGSSRSFVDLSIQRLGSDAFTRSRLFWREGTAPLHAHLVERAGEGGAGRSPGLLLLEGGNAPEEPWRLRAMAFSRPAFRPPSILRKVEAYTRAERYATAARLAWEGLLTAGATEAPALALALARASRRALDPDSLEDALARLEPSLAADGAPEARLSHAAREEAALLGAVLKGWRGLAARAPAASREEIRVDLGESTAPGESPNELRILHDLGDDLTLEGPADFWLSAEIEVLQLGFDRPVFLGLLPSPGPRSTGGSALRVTTPDRKAWGFSLCRSGGQGQFFNQATPVLGGEALVSPEEGKLLEEGCRYRLDLVTARDGRTQLRLEKLGPAAAGAPRDPAPQPAASSVEGGVDSGPVHLTHPPYDVTRPLEEDATAAARASDRLRPGGGDYRFCLADWSGRGGEVHLVFRQVELRLVSGGD